MKLIVTLLILIHMMDTTMIFDFTTSSELKSWKVVDDVVMGGVSSGSIVLDEDGYGVFSGEISLENNGGFSSLRHTFKKISVQPKKSKLKIRLKGDGKAYQLRLKDDIRTYYSYTTGIETTGEWQEVTVSLHEMRPTFRGRTVNVPNFDKSQIEEFTILIGNKKEETFKVLIDFIAVEN